MFDTPKIEAHGDLSSNAAMILSKKLKRNPREIAAEILANLKIDNTVISKMEIAGPGFINFFSLLLLLRGIIKEINENADNYGKSKIYSGWKANVEFVSANPTGAGVPAGAFHYVPGPGSQVGDAIVHHPDVGGITFTGSYDVGMSIYRSFASDYPKPVICEMGGKNPTIVTKNADLDKATDGVMRSAFGFGGQKCSANSRVYVEREVHDDFVSMLKDTTEEIKVGNPLDKDVYLGPVINESAGATYEKAVEEARKSGTVITGGERLSEGDLARGHFVAPTVVEVPKDNWLFSEELFV